MKLSDLPIVFIFSIMLIPCNSLQASDRNTQNRIEPIGSSIASISIDMDTLNGNVSQIRQSIESILHNTEAYVEESKKEIECSREKNEQETLFGIIGIIMSIINIVAVVYIYLRTQNNTKEQIKKQHEDTERQIKLSEKQIIQIQKNSDERTKKLEELGRQMQESTNTIRDSVKNLEQRFLIEHDKTRIEAPYSSIMSNYDALCKDIENEYSHFTVNSKNSIIHQRATKIKEDIGKVTQILSCYSENNIIPDAKAYIDSIDTVVEKPNFQNKREQINSFKNEGQKYNNQLTNITQKIFYKN